MKSWRHKQRGTIYVEIGRAELQASSDVHLIDGVEMVVYRGDDDGKMWCRAAAEFEDGRFEVCKGGEP